MNRERLGGIYNQRTQGERGVRDVSEGCDVRDVM